MRLDAGFSRAVGRQARATRSPDRRGARADCSRRSGQGFRVLDQGCRFTPLRRREAQNATSALQRDGRGSAGSCLAGLDAQTPRCRCAARDTRNRSRWCLPGHRQSALLHLDPSRTASRPSTVKDKPGHDFPTIRRCRVCFPKAPPCAACAGGPIRPTIGQGRWEALPGDPACPAGRLAVAHARRLDARLDEVIWKAIGRCWSPHSPIILSTAWGPLGAHDARPGGPVVARYPTPKRGRTYHPTLQMAPDRARSGCRCQVLFVISSDDPYGYRSAPRTRERLGKRASRSADRGHINGDSGLTGLPQGCALLHELLRAFRS